MSEKISTWQVLRNRFPAEEYVLIQEVSDASGFARSRSLDYMLINLWQSRGLAVTGIEQKSFRNDWQKELKNPAKQENHYKYCDHFYLLTDREGVAKMEEIPVTWGWMHINEKGLKVLKTAPKLSPIPIDRSLLCAMLRRAASKKSWIHEDNVESQIKERAEALNKQTISQLEVLRNQYKNICDDVAEFERASGVRVASKWGMDGEPGKIGEAVRTIINGDTEYFSNRLKYILSEIKRMQEMVSSHIDNIENIKLPLKEKAAV